MTQQTIEENVKKNAKSQPYQAPELETVKHPRGDSSKNEEIVEIEALLKQRSHGHSIT